MIKGINIFLLFMTVALTTFAGEEGTVVANINKGSPILENNNVVMPVVTEKYEYYEVCGCCDKDLQCDLKQKCITWTDGKKYDSVTNWKVKWDYNHKRTSQACTADSFLATVDVVFHLPKWVKTDNAPQPLVEKWDRYLKKLMEHEKGHRDRAVDAATELMHAVAELPPARTCAGLDREVNTLSQTRMNKLIEEQKEYDAATNHGIAQGAVFP